MTLDQQVQALLQDAPNDPEMRQITQIFIPMLKSLAGQRRHLQYFVAQTESGEWLRLSLINRTQSKQEKTVVYAFSTMEDANSLLDAEQDPPCQAVSIGLIDLLFKFFALNLGESLIFFEQPGDCQKGVEVRRSDFEDALYDASDIA